MSGPSKAGKSVLVQKMVGEEMLITVSGATVRQADQLWDRVLDWIGEPHVTTATTSSSDSKTESLEGNTSAGFPGVAGFQVKGSKGSLSGSAEGISATANRRGLPQVVKEIANSRYTLLVDDFHYIPTDVQTEVARQLKDAASRGVRICVASVPHRADQVVRALPELHGRVIAVDLDYWPIDELLTIPKLGCPNLGILIDDASLKMFATEAAGSPQLMQAICLWMCIHLGVQETQIPLTDVVLNEEQRRAILTTTSAMTDFRSLVRDLVGGPKLRGQERKPYAFKDGTQGDVYLAIMRAIAMDPPRMAFNYDELTGRIRKLCADAPPGSSVVGSCKHLGDIATQHLGAGGPALEWDEEDQILTIPEPYLLFYLRWSGHLERSSHAAR
jgi:hypothetical protein